ncbi:MAG: hypothetical protein U0326_39135 [Polyangiales bacterium]
MSPHRPSIRLLGCCALATMLSTTPCFAHPAPPRPPTYSLRRPPMELSPWVGLGGGAIVGPSQSSGVFDLRLGSDLTFGVGRKDDLRLGPFAEVATSTFASFQAVGGVELFVGAVPRPLRMFLYPGEGVLVVRLGAGWTVRNDNLPAARSVPVAAVTVAYGYRAPFSLRGRRSRRASCPTRAPRRAT